MRCQFEIHLLFWRGLQSVEVWADTRVEAARARAAVVKVLESMVAEDYTIATDCRK